MIVTILTDKDYAGSAYKIYQAITRHQHINAEIFTGKFQTMFQHPHTDNYIFDDVAKVQGRINMSDVIHIKGDWPPDVLEQQYRLCIRHKPIIQTVSGSHFRNRKYPMDSYIGLRTSFEPDLLYPDYGDILVPYPIDSMRVPIKWKRSYPPIFTHFPSSRDTKCTAFIQKVFDQLRSMMEFKLVMPKRRVPFKKAMEMRMQSTIYFDQFKVGAYGNAAVEMMQYGIPVACWISQESINQAKGAMNGHPIINTSKDVEESAFIIRHSWYDLEKISEETKVWCDKNHSYEAVANQLFELYKSIIKDDRAHYTV